MKKTLRVLSESILVLLFLSSLAVNPFRSRVPESPYPEPPRDKPGSGETASDMLSLRQPEPETLFAPEEIAGLFGWRKPEPRREPAPPEPVREEPEPPKAPEREPVTAGWMVLVGSVTGEGGRQVYFLKDTRKKQVIRVIEGEEHDGYRALKADGRYFLLEKGEERYKVELQ